MDKPKCRTHSMLALVSGKDRTEAMVDVSGGAAVCVCACRCVRVCVCCVRFSPFRCNACVYVGLYICTYIYIFLHVCILYSTEEAPHHSQVIESRWRRHSICPAISLVPSPQKYDYSLFLMWGELAAFVAANGAARRTVLTAIPCGLPTNAW